MGCSVGAGWSPAPRQEAIEAPMGPSGAERNGEEIGGSPLRSNSSPLNPVPPARADHGAGFMASAVLAEIPPSLPSALNPQPALPGRPPDTEHAKTASFCLCISNLFYLFDISHT